MAGSNQKFTILHMSVLQSGNLNSAAEVITLFGTGLPLVFSARELALRVDHHEAANARPGTLEHCSACSEAESFSIMPASRQKPPARCCKCSPVLNTRNIPQTIKRKSKCTTEIESQTAAVPHKLGKIQWSATGGATGVVRHDHVRSLLLRSLHVRQLHVRQLHIRPLQIGSLHGCPPHIRSLHLCPHQIRLLHLCPLQIRSLHVCALHVRSLRQERDLAMK
jgi:hypothetical protein